MSKHTPGPWSMFGKFNVTASGRGVATCGGWQDGKEGTFDENCANARLIAAAPEMLEALKEAHPFITDDTVRMLVGAAIAKAEGRS